MKIHEPILSPLLADVICKVNWKQFLLPTEEQIYLDYLDKIADEEVRKIVRKNYEDGKRPD